MKGISKGLKFGKWEVLNAIPVIKIKSDGRRESYVSVKCECGTKKDVAAYSLKNGTSTNCGCVRKQVGAQAIAWQGEGEVSKTALTSYLRSAVNSNPTMTNTGMSISPNSINTLLEQQDYSCSITSQPISFTNDTARVMRISSDKGYIDGNVELVHRDVYETIKPKTISDYLDGIRKTKDYFDRRIKSDVLPNRHERNMH